jgi:hypothetical protein
MITIRVRRLVKRAVVDGRGCDGVELFIHGVEHVSTETLGHCGRRLVC